MNRSYCFIVAARIAQYSLEILFFPLESLPGFPIVHCHGKAKRDRRNIPGVRGCEMQRAWNVVRRTFAIQHCPTGYSNTPGKCTRVKLRHSLGRRSSWDYSRAYFEG